MVAYKREGYEMFEAMIQAIREETVRRIFLARIQTNEELKREKVAKEAAAVSASDKTVKQQPVRKAKKGRPQRPLSLRQWQKVQKMLPGTRTLLRDGYNRPSPGAPGSGRLHPTRAPCNQNLEGRTPCAYALRGRTRRFSG